MDQDELRSLFRQRRLKDLDRSLMEKAHLEEVAQAGGATEARMIGLERRIATAQAALRSYETEP